MLDRILAKTVRYAEQHSHTLHAEQTKQSIALESVITLGSVGKAKLNTNANIVIKSSMQQSQQTESFAVNPASTSQAKKHGNQHFQQ